MAAHQVAGKESDGEEGDEEKNTGRFGDQGEFQPRDRSGKPIPTFRTDLMTRAQVLAVLSYPRDAALEAAATAEEEAMIAEWAARETPAGGREPDLKPPPGGG